MTTITDMIDRYACSDGYGFFKGLKIEGLTIEAIIEKAYEEASGYLDWAALVMARHENDTQQDFEGRQNHIQPLVDHMNAEMPKYAWKADQAYDLVILDGKGYPTEYYSKVLNLEEMQHFFVLLSAYCGVELR